MSLTLIYLETNLLLKIGPVQIAILNMIKYVKLKELKPLNF